MLVVYACGIPAFAFLVLRSIKGDVLKWQATYGFLYSAYEPEFWYWEVFIVLRKVLFAGAAVLMRPAGVDLQANTGVLIIVSSFGLQLLKRPFADPKLDTLEAIALYTQFATLFTGLYLFSPNTSEVGRQLLTALIFAVNGVFLVHSAHQLYQSSGASGGNALSRFTSSGGGAAGKGTTSKGGSNQIKNFLARFSSSNGASHGLGAVGRGCGTSGKWDEQLSVDIEMTTNPMPSPKV